MVRDLAKYRSQNNVRWTLSSNAHNCVHCHLLAFIGCSPNSYKKFQFLKEESYDSFINRIACSTVTFSKNLTHRHASLSFSPFLDPPRFLCDVFFKSSF